MTSRRRAVAALAASMAAASAAPARAGVPLPPNVTYTQGTAPGLTPDQADAAADRDTGTVYSVIPMDGFTKGHETGHIFDSQVLTDGDRHYFQRTLHAPAGDWYQGTGAGAGNHSPSEWFADYYGAAYADIDPAKTTVSSYTTIGPKRLRRFESALQRLGKRHQLKSSP